VQKWACEFYCNIYCSWLSASRRYQAADWLRQMDKGASRTLPKEPSEEEFCLALRNGLILCNVLNKVNPGAVLKVLASSNPSFCVSNCQVQKLFYLIEACSVSIRLLAFVNETDVLFLL
jgi:hypothetical protein